MSVEDLKENYEKPNSLMNKKIDLVNNLLSGGDKLLDVGFGTGELIKKVKNKYKIIVGLEPDKNAFNYVKKYNEMTLNLILINESLMEYEGEPQSFDSCTMLDVLEHNDNPKEMLLKVKKLLKGGGEVIVTAPNWVDKIRILRGGKKEHIFSLSSYGWAKLLKDAGFKIEVLRAVSFRLIKSEFLSKHFHIFGSCVLIKGKK